MLITEPGILLEMQISTFLNNKSTPAHNLFCAQSLSFESISLLLKTIEVILYTLFSLILPI